MSATALLQARALSRHYGGIRAVDGVDLALMPGELVCIIGPNGAGKSSLLGLLSGASAPSAGQIRFQDRDITGWPAYRFARAGIVRKFQGANTFQWLSVRDNLVVAGLAAAAHTGRDIPDLDEVLDLIKLRPQVDMIAESISHGQRQWLEVGMTLMCRPKLLLLDEPTAGMTVEGTREMAGLVRGLAGRQAIIVIEHDMAFVRQLDCRTLVMHQGAVIEEGSFATLQQSERVRDVYLGRRLRHAAH